MLIGLVIWGALGLVSHGDLMNRVTGEKGEINKNIRSIKAINNNNLFVFSDLSCSIFSL